MSEKSSKIQVSVYENIFYYFQKRLGSFLKKWAIPGLFFFIFVFSTNS